MPIASGQQYLDRINALKPNIWIEGEKLKGNVSEHRAFSGIMNSQAKLYDMQCQPSKSDVMTATVEGKTFGTSYLEPKTKEDLEKRRLMVTEWANLSAGMMGRSPDYMNTVLMTFAAASDLFSIQNKTFTRNMQSFFETAKEKDLSLTHTFINPQKNRSSMHNLLDVSPHIVAAQTIDKNADGLVIHGARLLATQGGITDEILVFPSHSAAFNEEHAYGFSIPTNTPGVKFISRESFSYTQSTFDHPLSSRFDEVDMIVVFDKVTVPWERVFFHHNQEIAYKIYNESSYNPLTSHQVLSRRIVKVSFLLGIAHSIIDMINIQEYQHIHEKISEIAVGLESLQSLLLVSELQAKQDKWGTMVPDRQPLYIANVLFAKIYPRFTEIIQQLGASGLIASPTEKDFASPLREDLDIYLESATEPAYNRVKIFRLAWDATMSAFGTRQTLYERYFFGDPIRLQSGIFATYPKDNYKSAVRNFLDIENPT